MKSIVEALMKFLLAFSLLFSLSMMVDLTMSESTGAVAFAKKKKRKGKKRAARRGGGRQRIVVKEKQTKMNKRDKTSVDFDEATLEGRRRNPSGIALNQQKANKDFDLIKLREHWKPEMVQSTSKLSHR